MTMKSGAYGSRMQSQTTSTPAPLDARELSATRIGPSVNSEITWLLHRAAQRLRSSTGEQAQKHGLQLRDYIVLRALQMSPNLSQGELGKALALDKTTLMSQVDRLARLGLVVRRSDPHDRRARIPEITAAGKTVCEEVASACTSVETAALSSFTPSQVQIFRRMLFEIIGDGQDRGSCL